MELELKTREYKKLCDELEKIKSDEIDDNDSILHDLKERFIINHDKIVQINKEIKELKNNQALREEQILEQYDTKNLFEKKDKINMNTKETNIAVIEKKKNGILEFFKKLRNILKK